MKSNEKEWNKQWNGEAIELETAATLPKGANNLAGEKKKKKRKKEFGARRDGH